jgi:RNAse (barnase) inhibitor barstar
MTSSSYAGDGILQNKTKGDEMTGKQVGIAIGVVVLLIVSCLGGWIIGVKNECVAQEAGIKAQYSQDQNNYDNMVKKIKETAQVPDMYVGDLKKVWDGVMTNRYGKNGSKAMFQWIQEHNPNVDSSLYRQIQQVIESGRLDFEANQKTLLDKKRIYESILNSSPGGDVAKFLGFPKIDLEKMGIVTSEDTEVAFKTKKAEPIHIH